MYELVIRFQFNPHAVANYLLTSGRGLLRAVIGFLQTGLLSLTSLRKTVTGKDGDTTVPALSVRVMVTDTDSIIWEKWVVN